MIGLDRIIGVLLDDMACSRQHLIEHPRVGGRPVGGHLSRSRAVFESTAEKAASGSQIPFFGDQNVDDLPELIDRSVQIDPPSGDFHRWVGRAARCLWCRSFS